MGFNAQEFLDAAYTELDFSSGDLVSSETSPTHEIWVEKGDWIALARQLGADKIFFVNGNPVVVFAKQDTNDPETLLQLYKRIWCMSRPNLLFLATPGALSVYDLNKPPERTSADWRQRKPLDRVENISEVATVLQEYHRAQIESGRLFEDERFGYLNFRADRALIKDLRAVRAELVKKGLQGKLLKYAHALIGRSIFIRYLEDRNILTREYFLQVAGKGKGWKSILDSNPDTPYAEPDMEELCYLKVLSDKDFTYALFDKLSEDFNGDMFPEDQKERREVKQEHLNLLQGFLRGDAGLQQKLFFWAYKFDVIPIELISSIYEEFYSAQNGLKDSAGTHYTPSALVDFLLSQALTPERLIKKPRILDPACGSGIFLVESFRRIVRYHVHKQHGRRLDVRQLRKIIREQIQGIDINEEAVRVSAFSLYLALLHYQEPPDILAQMKRGYCLPNLIKGAGHNSRSERFDILHIANSFSDEANLTADIVIGNPPWGDSHLENKEAREQAQIALDWCDKRGLPVGDRERSQTFIWRAIDLLEKGGTAALLVSSGILYKHRSKSKHFRRKFIQSIKLERVVNFAHVRKVFFADATAPFVSLIFENETPPPEHRFLYASAKKTAIVNSLQAVILTQPDFSFLGQNQIKSNDSWWKTFWWGNHHDAGLIEALKINPALGTEHPDTSRSKYIDFTGERALLAGRGYDKSGSGTSSNWLENYNEFPVRFFGRYGKLDIDKLTKVPSKVHRRGFEEIFNEKRLLVKRGITERINPKGQIISRYETAEFCFKNTIHGIKIDKAKDWEYKVILGIFWSSLARYYFFMTVSGWGIERSEIHLEEILRMPVCLPEEMPLKNRILYCVNGLRDLPDALPLEDPSAVAKIKQIESELDEAIFDLYRLSEYERDLVRDMCDVGIEFFYDPVNSKAARQVDLTSLSRLTGKISNLKDDPGSRVDIKGYLRTFLKIWNRELEPEGEFSWRVICPSPTSPMMAAIFSARPKGDPIEELQDSDDRAWQKLLKRLGKDLQVPYHSERIYIEGLVRAVTPTEIVIIKRNEGRFWTRSMAREDAEATLLKAMNLESAKSEAST